MKFSIGTSHLTKCKLAWVTQNLSCRGHTTPIGMKHYNWVRSEIKKLIDACVIHSSHSSWSAPIIVVSEGDGGKHLVVDYRALNKDTWEICMALAKSGKTSFQSRMVLVTYQHSISVLGTNAYPLMKTLFPKQLLHLHLENMSTWKFPLH